MRVLVACEYSAIVRDAFLSAGHDAFSCDIIPRAGDNRHICNDAIEVCYFSPRDLIIAHPPCTFLCKAQLHLCTKSFERSLSQIAAFKFFKLIYDCPCPQLCIENPAGIVPRLFRKADQIIQPYNFGDPYKKEICLWLKGLPKLFPGELSPGRKSMNNHTNGRMTQLEKSKIRSRFFPGIAKAMANQWGK